MCRDGERGDYGAAMPSCEKRELREIQRRCFLEISDSFFDSLALGCGPGFRIQRDEAAFFGGSEYGSEFHDALGVALALRILSQLLRGAQRWT